LRSAQSRGGNHVVQKDRVECLIILSVHFV
jgi:hypothetical protein